MSTVQATDRPDGATTGTAGRPGRLADRHGGANRETAEHRGGPGRYQGSGGGTQGEWKSREKGGEEHKARVRVERREGRNTR